MNQTALKEADAFLHSLQQFDNADSIYAPVRKAATLVPYARALRYLGKNISYKTLQKNADALCSAFKAAGFVGREAVTLVLPNVPESVYLLYAAAGAGLTAAPLHPLISPAQIAAAMEKSGSRIVFCLKDRANEIAAAVPQSTVVAFSPARSLGIKRALYAMAHRIRFAHENIYTLSAFLKGKLPERTHTPCGVEAAVLLQSSGTTGEPKSIALTHGQLNALAARGYSILESESVIGESMLSVLPIFHGFGLVMGVHAMLCHGGCNTLFPQFHRAPVVKEVKKGNVQYMIGVPLLYEALLSHPHFNGKALQSLRLAFVGGDFVPQSLLERFNARMKEGGSVCTLCEGYGLTETVTVCSVNVPKATKAGTVGKPLTGIEIEAFDFEVSPPQMLARDVAGELAVCGDTNMLCYAGDEEATNHTFFTYEGKRYVRTGDRGFTDSEGYVHFISRIKRILKVSGIPVYPSEIEQCAAKVQGVTDACVLGIPDERKGEVPVLFVATKDDPKAAEAKIAEHLKVALPPYACPTKVFAMPMLPRTPLNKIDTEKLKSLFTK
ncbi:MAG: acyl--CoA ligase [Clostridiales bacterium]|nr:acyl--CoA ligase [Clostridiales bacterium]